MNQQLRFPFPRPATTEEDAAAPPVRERRREFPRHPLGIDSVPFHMPARAAVDAAIPDPPASYDRLRSRRARAVRAKTVSVKRMPKRELELGRALYPDDEELPAKPTTREGCSAVQRPCPFVSCVHHLYLDVSARTGALKMNFPDLEPHELPADASCALDVADRDGESLQNVGNVMNITRERVRQVEVKALSKLEALFGMRALRDLVDGRPGRRDLTKRRLPVLQEDEDVATDSEADFDPSGFASEDLDEA